MEHKYKPGDIIYIAYDTKPNHFGVEKRKIHTLVDNGYLILTSKGNVQQFRYISERSILNIEQVIDRMTCWSKTYKR